MKKKKTKTKTKKENKEEENILPLSFPPTPLKAFFSYSAIEKKNIEFALIKKSDRFLFGLLATRGPALFQDD